MPDPERNPYLPWSFVLRHQPFQRQNSSPQWEFVICLSHQRVWPWLVNIFKGDCLCVWSSRGLFSRARPSLQTLQEVTRLSWRRIWWLSAGYLTKKSIKSRKVSDDAAEMSLDTVGDVNDQQSIKSERTYQSAMNSGTRHLYNMWVWCPCSWQVTLYMWYDIFCLKKLWGKHNAHDDNDCQASWPWELVGVDTEENGHVRVLTAIQIPWVPRWCIFSSWRCEHSIRTKLE